MSIACYEDVKSSSAKLHSSGYFQQSKQRKWRVLLSIGLLLPALAAIIGIVAWAISIEVASGSGAGSGGAGGSMASSAALTSSGSHRKFAHQHQNQYQHQLQLQNSLSNQKSSTIYHQLRRHQQSSLDGGLSAVQQQELLEEARNAKLVATAALVQQQMSQRQVPSSTTSTTTTSSSAAATASTSAPTSTSTSTAAPPTSTSTSISASSAGSAPGRRRGAFEVDRTEANRAKTKSESGDEEANSSALLLTNLDQAEALNESARPEADNDRNNNREVPAGSPQDGAGEGGELSGGKAASEEGGEAESSSTLRADDLEAEGGEFPMADDEDEQQQVAGSMEAKDQQQESLSSPTTTTTTTTTAAATSTSTTTTGAPAKRVTLAAHKNSSHKSRWMADKTNNKRPINPTAPAHSGHNQPLRQRLLANKYESTSSVLGNNRRQQFAGGKAANEAANSRYIIVDRILDFEKDAPAGESAKRPAGSRASSAAIPAARVRTAEEAAENENDNDDAGQSDSMLSNAGEQQDHLSGKAAGEEKSAPRSGASRRQRVSESGRGKQFHDLQQQQQQQQQQEDEISFEAIASAISTTMEEANSQRIPRPQKELPASLEGDTGSLLEPSSMSALGDSSAGARRRTTGEHVADVIDQIVGQRQAKQQLQSRNRQAPSISSRGPQIVVVAPVGPDAASMRARSLTKASPADESSKTATKTATAAAGKQPVVEDKRISASIKKEAIAVALAKKQSSHANKSSKPILAARLLGGPTWQASDRQEAASNAKPIKYSERVEVIEDDDSSAFLVKPTLISRSVDSNDSLPAEEAEESDEQQEQKMADSSMAATGGEQVGEQSSIHVSSQPGEARSRSVRHELDPRQAFERYAPLPVEQVQHQKQQISDQPKLYSAEQVIRNHVLKSKFKSPVSSAAGQLSVAPMGGSDSKPASENSTSVQQQQQQQQQSTTVTAQTQAKVIPTTIRPHHPHATNQEPASHNRQQQAANMAGPKRAFASSIQSVKVPLFFQYKQPAVMAVQPLKQDTYQTMESQQHYQQALPVEASSSGQQANQPQTPQQNPNQQSQQGSPQLDSQQHQSHLVQNHHHQLQQQQQQQHSGSQLPQFADQEFNVPAHLADSVIQDIQRSPPTVGMVNGQQMFVSGPGQVPYLNQHLYQAASQYLPSQQYQHQLMAAAASQPQSMFWNQLASQPQQQLAWRQYMLARQQQQQQQQLQEQQYLMASQQYPRQVLAERNGVETAPAGPISVSVKPPRGLVHPVAQMALRHLFSSIGQQQQQSADPSTASSSVAGSSLASESPSSSSASGGSSGDASGPAASAAQLMAQTQSRSLSAGQPMIDIGGVAAESAPPMIGDSNSGTRIMRSLPGAAGASGIQQQHHTSNDLEVQESYGPQPAYHMGGGGGGYHESEHDKKSKGVTFHFGGGPIGGGTQLITSPMGIFKHLMIPLMPNPQVNLNGKIVFGVVLEKTTGFGGKPKKKTYKFWGR